MQVWRMTVRHLRNGRNLHQVLYAYSPQDIVSDVEYMYGYPGDEKVARLRRDRHAHRLR